MVSPTHQESMYIRLMSHTGARCRAPKASKAQAPLQQAWGSKGDPDVDVSH